MRWPAWWKIGAAVLLAVAGVAWGQGAAPQFEVASIKPVDPNTPHMVGVKILPGARVVLSALPLKGLIAIAYGISYWQISGGEAWMAKDNFDIEAKTPESVLPRVRTLRYSNFGIEDENLREMLRTLLVERFGLKLQREIKAGNVYRLESKGDAPRLKPVEAPAVGAEGKSFGSIGFVGGRWSLYSTSMAQLAKFAADNILHAPVVDGTGLHGIFDYRQAVALSEGEANYRDNTDSFLNWIAELGLRLEKAKGPVEGLVILGAERPAAN